MQRQEQHNDVDSQICSSDSPVVILEIDAVIGEQHLRIESIVKRVTLENVHENRHKEPKYADDSNHKDLFLECWRTEDSAV